jgi:hypothetical protein
MLVDVMQPEAGLDIAAILGEGLLHELDLADAVVDVDAENHVFGLHGKLLWKKRRRNGLSVK